MLSDVRTQSTCALPQHKMQSLNRAVSNTLSPQIRHIFAKSSSESELESIFIWRLVDGCAVILVRVARDAILAGIPARVARFAIAFDFLSTFFICAVFFETEAAFFETEAAFFAAEAVFFCFDRCLSIRSCILFLAQFSQNRR